MNIKPYMKGCSECRLCKGAAYQMPPFLYAGSGDPSILVIAQNPGEIGSDDKWRPKLQKYAFSLDSAVALKVLYDVDFITSHGYEMMEKIFGEGWFLTGKFMYTNAVRCRTPKNGTPSSEMISNCMSWTAQLPLPPLVVLMGSIARKQFCEMVKKPELDVYKIVKLKREQPVRVMTIPHYAAMKPKDFDQARDLFEKAMEEAGLS